MPFIIVFYCILQKLIVILLQEPLDSFVDVHVLFTDYLLQPLPHLTTSNYQKTKNPASNLPIDRDIC